ncbi:class I poly(R)-hydroxyalkanoic acid synthase [Sphingomonas panacisoli]|uniref:Class I poly(R)-hydroxyalkanoic acid synthase n=1 Tax=Sphingomonas panacisoli TaxID=1813879 RepID=A0A5B8LE45_9SPHN|nr:alpha/beta fold hydrolase [Sphingomonas panacisoli]QDZ06351.1 class I poly(R)-hydroxyalkanoic acid synthase [Sphingomonas panacisoli]
MTDQSPAALWQDALANITNAMTQAARTPMKSEATRPYDPLALMQTMSDFAVGLGRNPQQLLEVQLQAAHEWGDFWSRAFLSKTDAEKPRDRRFASPEWQDNPYYRTIRDAYLLASKQIRSVAQVAEKGDTPNAAMIDFLVDQYLNAIAPTNFAMTNPDVVKRTVETGGANLAQGFAHLIEDVAEGKRIVRRRTADAFEKGKTIAATPGSVVFQNHLFQLIQYDPTTKDVAADPLLYVPPLVNKFYMIDLQPKSSLVKWLVDQGRTVFVISWINPDERHRDCGVEQYVLDGIVEAIGQARAKSGADKVDLFSFCLGGTLVSVVLAWLQAKGRAGEVNTATLIGSMVDFADMRDWAAFVHEAHLDALEGHLERQGFIDSTELQQLFAAVRSNDLIWSSVINHYLLDKAAPPSDLLYWFEDGARIPHAFLKSYNRGLLANNALKEKTGFAVGGVEIDLASVKTPIFLIALKDDHVSAWSAVYDGGKLFGGPVTFVLGGSGHNAGVINPPAANKHGFWTSDAKPGTAQEWLAGATRNEGSWWPSWNAWLAEHGSGKRVPGRMPADAIEPAPGSYVSITH